MLFSAIVRLVISDIARTGPFITVMEAAPTAPTRATAPNMVKKMFPDSPHLDLAPFCLLKNRFTMIFFPNVP